MDLVWTEHDNYFWVTLEHFWIKLYFLMQPGALTTNRQNQVKLVQISETHCCIVKNFFFLFSFFTFTSKNLKIYTKKHLLCIFLFERSILWNYQSFPNCNRFPCKTGESGIKARHGRKEFQEAIIIIYLAAFVVVDSFHSNVMKKSTIVLKIEIVLNLAEIHVSHNLKLH